MSSIAQENHAVMPGIEAHNALPAKMPERIVKTDSVLVADDDGISRGLLESWLKKWQFNVTTAEDGLHAWQEIQKEDAPNLIILDWMMPGLSGIDVCRKIRARKTAHYPYILLLTSKSAKHDVVEALNAGADDYVTKPFAPNELMARLKVGRRILCLQNDLLLKEDELRFAAQHDSLTKLWNHGAILRFLDQEISRARRAQTSVGVLMIDIDHFKRINDTYGHPAGDAILKEVSHRLALGTRTYDWVGRYGGEEFVVVVADSNAETVALCAERLRESVASTPMSALGTEVQVTVSVGAALLSGSEHSDILQLADAALYRAKNNGRNRVETAWRT
jgi:two-component system, cell cycle response regulator